MLVRKKLQIQSSCVFLGLLCLCPGVWENAWCWRQAKMRRSQTKMSVETGNRDKWNRLVSIGAKWANESNVARSPNFSREARNLLFKILPVFKYWQKHKHTNTKSLSRINNTYRPEMFGHTRSSFATADINGVVRCKSTRMNNEKSSQFSIWSHSLRLTKQGFSSFCFIAWDISHLAIATD